MSIQIYLITPPKFDPEVFRSKFVEALDAGDVACVQLRMKSKDGVPAPRDEVRRAAQILMPEAQSRDVAFLINDDAELAAEIGADGVHVGQDDMTAKQARQIVGKDAIVGVTCHNSRHLAMEAAEDGADYVAFGAFYPTDTKTAKTQADPEILEIWTTMTTVPCVAIGGITAQNAPPLIEAGAEFIAVISYVWDHADGPGAAIKTLSAL
ncbi:thiamine phosphate synthase [Magnetovibrio sp. PR-2]|uniref:thiamine phosphate synthase n=1 Tax=Magnetovibrio sp. PR-2 TaxID=3120356 RepID=UPI002FCE0E1B